MSDLVRSVSEIFNDSKLKQVYYNSSFGFRMSS